MRRQPKVFAFISPRHGCAGCLRWNLSVAAAGAMVIVNTVVLVGAVLGRPDELIRTALARGDWLCALRLASRFHDRSDDTIAFKRGFDAFRNPQFYRQLGKDPDELIHSAIERLQAR